MPLPHNPFGDKDNTHCVKAFFDAKMQKRIDFLGAKAIFSS